MIGLLMSVQEMTDWSFQEDPKIWIQISSGLDALRNYGHKKSTYPVG